MNKIVISILILFAISINSVGQGGYLGRKNAIYITGDVASYQFASLATTPWNKRLGVAVARSVNRNAEVMLQGQYMVGGIHPGSYQRERTINHEFNIGNHNMVAIGGKLAIKLFRYSSGSISPIGSYWGMELSVDHYRAEDTYRFESGLSDTQTQRDMTLTFTKSQFWFKTGWQNMLGDHFIYGAEIRLGAPPFIFGALDDYGDFFMDKGVNVFGFYLDEFAFGGYNNIDLAIFVFSRNFIVPEAHFGFVF